MASLDDEMRALGMGKGRGMSALDKEMSVLGIAPRQPEPEPDEGILSNIWKGSKAGVAGSLGGLAGWFGGKNAVTDYTDEVLQENQRSREHDGYDADYFLNGSGFAYDVGNLLGSFASMAPAALLVPGGAPATIASAGARLLGGLGARELARRAAVQAAQKGGGALGNYIRYGLGAGTAESLVEGGSGVSRAVQEGQEGLSPYLTGAEIAAKNWPLLVGSQALEGGILHRGFSRLGGKAGESLAKRAGLAPFRATPYAAAEGLTESAQEVMQERAQEEAFNEPTGGFLPSDMTENERKALYATFAPAALLGGIGGVRGSMRAKGNEPEGNAPAPYVANWDNGMNGLDTDLFDKWESAPGMTDLTGVRRDVVAALNGLANEYGGKITITGAAEKGVHAEGADGHEGGWKVDIDKNLADPEKFLELAAKYGFAVGDEGDHYDLSANRKGGVGGKQVATPDAFVSDGQQPRVQREGHENAWAIYDVFKAAGYNDNAIAGILGRVQHEHNFDTSDVPEHEEEGMHLGGYGMFQWNGGRTTAFLNWAQENGLDPQDATTQARYALFEAKQRGLTPEKMNQLSAEEAADLWTSDWEVGKPGDERKYAGEWLTRLQNGGGMAGGTATSTRTPQAQQEPQIDTYDDVYEQFAKEMSQSSDEETKDFFSGMFTKNDKFIDNEENRRQIDERYGEEFKEFADVYRNPSVQTQIDRLIDKAVEAKDYNRVGKLQAARRSGDIQLMQKYLDEARAQEVPQMQGQTVPQVIPQQTPAQNVPQAQPAFPIVQEPAQNAPQPAQQTEQAQPIQIPTQTIETPQNEPVQDTTEADNSMLRNLQTEIEDIKQKYSNGEITPVQAYSALKSQEEIFSRYNDSLGNKAMGMIAQAKNDFRTGSVPSPQTGGNINGNESTENPQTPAPQSENTVNQNQNSEPGQAEAEEVNQPVQQEAPQANGFVNNTVTTKKGKQFPGVTWDGRVEKDEWARRRKFAKENNGWWDGKSKSFGFRTEQDRENFLQAVNAPVEETSTTTSQPVQQVEQEKPKKESKALSQYKKNVAKVVSDYRKDKITYEDAFHKVVSMQESAESVAPDQATKDEIQDVARGALMELESIYNEKNGHELGETPSQTAQESAGEQETTAQVEEPTQGKKPAQSEAEPASNEGGEKSAQKPTVEENSTVDDDYHGFLDDKEPGAVAEIRRQLEKTENPFGNAKGFMTTKRIVERWAETDKTNQSKAKGKTFYLHGNKVSKAVYDYYNHLILDNYINSLDENGNPKQTKQESSGAYTKVITPQKKSDPFRVEVDITKLDEYDNSRFNVRLIAKKHEALTNGKLAKDSYTFKFDTLEAAKAYADEIESYIAKYLQKDAEPKQEKPTEAENNTVKEPAKEEGNNEQQAESGSPDGGHEGVRAGEGRSDQREGTGEVSGRDGRKGKGHGSDNVEENSEEPQSAGVRAGAELGSAASTGTDKRGNQPDVPLTEAQAHPSPTETPGHNYEIKESGGEPNKRDADVRYKQNIDAIKLLRQLEDEERMATPAEQKILAQFNGWGGLTSKFKEGSETDKELRSLLSAEEYKDAQRSSLSAYYTPPKIVKAIWAGLSHLGFKGGRILDPAMGVGNFFGCMPRDIMAKSVLDGVEMESLAARLARQLYPGADVQNTVFQRSNTPKNFYDLVITNIPFEQTIVNGYQVHNYYFAAGIDKVRPGGLMVYITGQGSLASGSDAARMRTYLNKEADLIGAFKLPSGVFDATQVGTDVVVFQKRIDGKKSPNGQDFTEVERKGTYGNFYGVNQYFTQHRENVLGEMSVGKNRFGDAELNVKSRGTVEDVANELEAAMKKLPKNVYEPVSRNNSKPFNPSETAKRAKADEKTRDREYYYKDGKIVQNQNGQETEIKGKQAEVVESYVKLKNSLNALLAAETDPKATDKQVESLRDMLNRDYNDFVKKHGYLHGANKRHFDDDPSSGMVQSLETPIETEEKTKSGATKKKVTGAKKASIFSERSTNPKKEVTHVDTASDALVASLNNTGGLDLEYMAKLTGKTQEKLLSELKGTVFKDPATENFVTKDEYLSGNVREKLILAKEMAKRDKSYAANVKALEEVQPEELVPEEIFVSLGTPWIPAQDVNDFVHTIANGKFTVHYNSALAKWTVTGWLNSTKFGTQHIDFDDFLTKVLNGQVIEIKYTDEDKKTHVDEAATKAVTAEAERLQAEFKEWIWKDKERAKRLTDYYNANFNNYVLREYDGSHLDPHEHGMNAKITLKPHQKDAVWRILQSGNTLLAHCVGAGKTFEMQTAGMEMRRLGMANKPMYLVPLNVVDQFAKDFRRLYPGAKLLVLTNDDLPQVKLTKKVTKTDDGRIEITDLTKDMSAKEKERIAKNKAKRARTLARVRTEDWDGIIMSHTLFKELPVSPETQAAYMEEEFKRLEAALKEAKQTDSLDGTAKRTLEEQKAKLKEKMEEARSVDVKDLGITFEQLGIDQLFVDEADLFKNLHFTSSKTSGNAKIKGITNPQANYKHRAFDMFLKTQWLSKMLNGRGVVFATGTPISNSMAELYTMMRYLDPQGLKEHGTELFDSWIGVFGDIGQDTQLNSTGTNWETVTKVRSYNNRPELLKMFRKFADIKQPSDLPDIQRPALKGGKPTIIDLPVDPAVSRYLKERVPKRIAAMTGGFKKQKGEDNMLALMNDLRNLSLSDSKIEACADTIVSEYKDSTPVKGTQLVFCDLGIPKAASEKEDANDDGPSKKVSEIANPDVYRKLIEKLVKKGIPREQIAFIQDYPKEKRQAVFEKVNNGEIRILIGSTTAMGAGTNCQKHLVALHDLDAPWRPRDLEQRHGRILRQGNENSEVSIYQYALKGSFDAVIWSKLKEKALLIELAMSSDMNSRSMEEADIITLEYSEMVGHSLDDPLMKAKVDTENELSKVRNAQTEFSKKVQRAASTLETIDDKIETHQRAVEHIKKDIAGRKSTRGDNFSMTVGNKTFTKRDDAGNAMEARLKDFDESKPTVVGSLGGFALKAVKTITGIEMEVVGKHAYPVKTISVQGLENTVNVQVDDALEREEAYLDYLNQQKKDALDIQGQENPYAEKVKSLEEKLADLNRQIKERAVEESKKQNDTETEEAQEEKPSSNKEYSVTEGRIESRSIEDIKAGAREAYPNAKIQEDGNTLHLTMPNGQKVHISIVSEINASEDELSRAKEAHGIDQGAQVSVEGYAEVVGGEGFSAVAQGSRDVTDFHEAYHMAELMAFTKKELRDAERLISPNSEERADEYAKWRKARKKGNNFAKLWQKIADVAAKLAGILGYETKRNIFRKVESGEIYQRDNTARNTSRQYSVNASDNSTSSYKQRVKNFFMGKQDAPSHRRMLKNMMEEIADVKISYGKLDEGTEAIYKSAQKVIRVRNANDWEKVVPLFAKAVCDKIGIKADRALTHYISDWIQTGAPNNNSAEADTFAKAMREHPEIADQLLDLQSAFMRWNQMDAMERMQSIVSRREKEKTSISSMLDYAYDQIVEELGPVKRLVKQIEGKIGKQENALNPYVAFRLFRGHHGRAMTMLEGSGADMKAVLARHYPNLNWDGFKTLHEILDSIGGLHDEKIRDEFGNYALACHVYDIHLRNDQIQMQIDMLNKQLEATTDAGEKKKLDDEIKRLDKSIMMTPISRTDCGSIIREYGKKYGQAQQDLVHFSNMTLAILKDSGVISETRYARILRRWPNYVPMFRVFDENENKNFGDSLKALEGSTRDVIDPLESIIRNTFDFVKKAEKNKAKCLLARLAQVSDVGKYIEPVDNNKPNDDTVITYYVDGQKRYLQTDPSVVAAVNGMGIDQSNLLMKILRFPARLARSAITVTNPAFLIRNSTRDMQDAFIYNDRGTITPMDFVRAFMHAFRKDDIYWEWMSSGAAQASAISIDRDYAQATLDKMTKSWKQMFKDNPVTFPFKAFLDATERLAEFSEMGTRIAAYERTKKALVKDGAALTNMDLAEAAYESRDLMDFARGGKASRQWNSLAIFANASIQGWDKFFRTFNVRKNPKAAMRAMARLAIGGMLPALLLTLANWDEDWWKEIPDWQKDSHWILAPNVRIPKGQDIGLRFVSSMIEKGLDAMHNNNPLTAKRALKPIYDQTPDILPTAMLPVIEAIANYSFFKEAPIVPQYQKDLPAKLQYSGTTSGLAKALGDLLNYSPRKIDHLIQGYTGSVGKGATSAMDMARGEKRMNTAIEEMPVFSGFMMTPYKNAATVEKFYQEFRKQTEGDKAFKATHERMEGYSPAKYKRMNQASKKMSELNKKERKLLDDNRISPERKQELQAGIQRQRIAIAKRAMGVK